MKRYWLYTVISLLLLFLGSTLLNASFAVDTSLKPTINPTDYIRRLTETPVRKNTEPLQKKPPINPTEYILRLSITPVRKPTAAQERKPVGSASGTLLDKREGEVKRLTEQKLKMCMSLSKSVTTRSLYLVKSITEMERKFTSIIDGIKRYYLLKIIPTGVTLSNYNTLVADITARERIIPPLLEKAQKDASGFSCTTSSPSAQLKEFSLDVQAVVHALQEYRTGIKNLIVAIRTLHIPEPTVTPVATDSSTIDHTASQ